MKYLGIDYGTKKIGLAVSDERGMIAFPKSIISPKNAIAEIADFVVSESIEKIVIGKSMNLDGQNNMLQKSIDIFGEKLRTETGLEIISEDERMSSVAARSHLWRKGNIENKQWSGKQNQKRREAVDAGAAAVILQRYLDRR